MENLCNISVIKEILKRHRFNFSKSLGQNFLINPTVCPKIAQMGIENNDCGVLEVGPGIGVLTNELAKNAKKVVAVEIDKALPKILKETLSDHDNIKIINSDVMKIDLHKLIEDEFPDMDVCVCANLPYYITSPVIMQFLEERLPIKSLTVMVQKEAAQRLCAKVGTRESSAITFAVAYYSDPELLFDVSRGSFMPAPNVDSAVIKLNIKEKPTNVVNETLLFTIVRAAFTQRRKTLVNPVSKAVNVEKKVLAQILSSLNIDVNIRPEKMTFDNFIDFSNKVNEII